MSVGGSSSRHPGKLNLLVLAVQLSFQLTKGSVPCFSVSVFSPPVKQQRFLRPALPHGAAGGVALGGVEATV